MGAGIVLHWCWRCLCLLAELRCSVLPHAGACRIDLLVAGPQWRRPFLRCPLRSWSAVPFKGFFRAWWCGFGSLPVVFAVLWWFFFPLCVSSPCGCLALGLSCGAAAAASSW